MTCPVKAPSFTNFSRTGMSDAVLSKWANTRFAHRNVLVPSWGATELPGIVFGSETDHFLTTRHEPAEDEHLSLPVRWADDFWKREDMRLVVKRSPIFRSLLNPDNKLIRDLMCQAPQALAHMLRVSHAFSTTGDMLDKMGVPIDMDLGNAAAALHDTGKLSSLLLFGGTAPGSASRSEAKEITNWTELDMLLNHPINGALLLLHPEYKPKFIPEPMLRDIGDVIAVHHGTTITHAKIEPNFRATLSDDDIRYKGRGSWSVITDILMLADGSDALLLREHEIAIREGKPDPILDKDYIRDEIVHKVMRELLNEDQFRYPELMTSFSDRIAGRIMWGLAQCWQAYDYNAAFPRGGSVQHTANTSNKPWDGPERRLNPRRK